MGGSSEVEMEEGDLELGLGLSLGGGGCGSGGAGGGRTWGECGRILTARDFPSVGSKRAADSVSLDGGSPPRSSQVVGWPPIGAHRMNSLINQSKNPRPEEEEEEKEEEVEVEDNGSNNKSKNKKKEKADGEKDRGETKEASKKSKVGFVKVKLDGIPIGRKVDLNAHSCYQTLALALEDMFFKSKSSIGSIGSCLEKEKPKCLKLLDGSSEFALTYEDKDGDWMLVGDVPWRMFISSVRRLRIMRNSEAKGLAPRFQEQSERQTSRPV